jgi:hypothetical protein
MKARLGTLIERDSGSGRTYLAGTLGEAVIIIERDGITRSGEQRWRLMLAPPDKSAADPENAKARNRRGAHWRIERRRAEQIEQLGGRD